MPTKLEPTGDRTELGTAADDHVSTPSQPLRAGTSLGRYTLLEPLGMGAMGSVFAAHDPLLDRRVALKVLHPARRSARGTERLQREARALARLSHPNVVTINDVGRSGDLVYIAMELVDGHTLGAWLEEAPRDWRRVLRVMLEAGRGLAAAHDAGLVHRDFKPDNVMLARDGRVLLADFGIALAASEPSSEPTSGQLGEITGAEGEGAGQPSRLTRTGALLGTPRYMAPEQFLELDADPRTDQWAFCVVAWEALFGRHPVPGDTLGEIALSVTTGAYRTPPSGHCVPPSIVRAICKGMAVEREERHASMAELLARLSSAHGRRGRRWVIALGLAAVASAVAVWPPPADDVSPCDADARMAEVWNDSHADAVTRAFDATSLPLRTTTERVVLEGLDEYSGRWTDAYAQACADRGTKPTQSVRQDERFACLNARLESMAHLVGMLEDVDDEVVPHAANAVLDLAEVEPCLDLDEASADIMAWPADPVLRQRVEHVAARLDEAEALRSLGRFEDALVVARRAHQQGAAIDHPPLHARSALVLGIAERDVAEGDHGHRTLARAFELATGQGMDQVAARAALGLAGLHTVLRDRAQARRWIRHAEAAVERLAGSAALEIDLLIRRASLCRTLGDHDGASGGDHARCRELQQQAIDATVEVFGPRSVRAANAHSLMGVIEQDGSRYERAIHQFETAREILVSSLGPDHPKVAEVLTHLQDVYRVQGDFKRAHRIAEAVLPVLEAAYGADHPRFLEALDKEATVLASEGEHERALRLFDRTLEGSARAYGPDHARVSACLSNRSIVLGALGRHDQAIADLKRALRIAERTYDPASIEIAILLDNLGHALVEGGRPDDAVPLHERALAIWETRAPGLPDLAISLTDHGRALLTSQHPEDAVPLLERAISIFEAHAVDPAEGARAHFLLAQALDSSGRDEPRALELARRARDLYSQAQGQGHAADLETIEAWLAEPRVYGQGNR